MIKKHKREHGGTGFDPLPRKARKHGAVDDLCCCMYCSNDGLAKDNPHGVWDTVATSLTTGETWYVHYPELHGRKMKRQE